MPDAVWEQDQQIARARAMCRAAVQVFAVEPPSVAAGEGG
jgi:hypothetical protein